MTYQYVNIVMILSVVNLVFGILYFLNSDKAILLFSDSFVLASSLFIGLPGIITSVWWPFWIDWNSVVISGLGLMVSFVVAGASTYLRSILIPGMPITSAQEGGGSHFVFWRYLTFLIVAGSVSSTISASLGADLSQVPKNFSYLAVGSSFILLLLSQKQKISVLSKVLYFVFFGLVVFQYIVIFFDGGGRLIVATMIYCLAAILGFWYPRLPIKKIIIFSLIPALIAFGFIRGTTGELEDVLMYADGLESVYGPYQICTSVFEHVDLGVLAYQKFDPFVSTMLFWVPRFLWPSKPFGFGFELTRHFHPELIYLGHSMAATYLGELYVSAGWLALLIGLLFVVGAIVSGDLILMQVIRSKLITPKYLLKIYILAILTSGVFDYVWVGSFNFTTRNILRIILLCLCAVIIWAIRFSVVSDRTGWTNRETKVKTK